eukprot:2425545-Amphidinium_carterae.1
MVGVTEPSNTAQNSFVPSLFWSFCLVTRLRDLAVCAQWLVASAASHVWVREDSAHKSKCCSIDHRAS